MHLELRYNLLACLMPRSGASSIGPLPTCDARPVPFAVWLTGLKSYTSLYTLDGNAVLDKRGARDHNAGLVAMNAVTSLGTSRHRQLRVKTRRRSCKPLLCLS